MKCDVCKSEENVGTYCHALDTINICRDCFKSIRGIHIAAIINSRKNKIIAELEEIREQWAKEELVIQQGKRENFRTMYCDNCENYQSDKCSRCFSYGYTYPVNFKPAKHFLFKEPHPKDARIKELEDRLELAYVGIQKMERCYEPCDCSDDPQDDTCIGCDLRAILKDMEARG